jgi:hypothetical protein
MNTNQTQYSANCNLLGTGDKASDHAHVSRVTPIQTKAKELADDKKYRTALVPDINKAREQRTTRLRRQTQGTVKPL